MVFQCFSLLSVILISFYYVLGMSARGPVAETESSGRVKEKAGGKKLDSMNKTTVENKKERTGASESASEVKRNKKGQLVFEGSYRNRS